MANRKGHMKELLRGIVTENAPTAEEQFNDDVVSQETIEKLGISPELEEALNRKRSATSGRPKQSKGGESTEYYTRPDERRATLILKKEAIRKMKYIALMDTKLIKEVYAEAISYYVEMWESEHGTINLPKKGE